MNNQFLAGWVRRMNNQLLAGWVGWMNNQLFVGWGLATLGLLTYFFIGILLTGEVAPFVGVLFFELVVWFLVYKFRYNNLSNRELVMKMYADPKRMLESVIERFEEDETLRREVADHRKQVLMEWEKRRADMPKEAPTAGKYKYVEMITLFSVEKRVREAQAAKGNRSEGSTKEMEA